jgi:hypothetical protein
VRRLFSYRGSQIFKTLSFNWDVNPGCIENNPKLKRLGENLKKHHIEHRQTAKIDTLALYQI